MTTLMPRSTQVPHGFLWKVGQISISIPRSFSKETKSDSLFFSVSQILGMGRRQNTQQMKQNQICENSKHALRSTKQQHAIRAHVLSDTELIGWTEMKLNEVKYNDLSDGRYEKTKNVKTWTGRTVSIETDLTRAVEAVKRQLEAKIGIPKDHQHLVSRGKVLTADRTLKNSFISGGETVRIDSTATGRNETQKSEPHSNGCRQTEKEKIMRTVYWCRRTWRNRGQSQRLKKRKIQQKNWKKSVMKELKERKEWRVQFRAINDNSTAWNERSQSQYEEKWQRRFPK